MTKPENCASAKYNCSLLYIYIKVENKDESRIRRIADFVMAWLMAYLLCSPILQQSIHNQLDLR